MTKKEVEKVKTIEEVQNELDQVKQKLEEKNKEYETLLNEAKKIIAEKDKRIMELVGVNELYIKMVQGK